MNEATHLFLSLGESGWGALGAGQPNGYSEPFEFWNSLNGGETEVETVGVKGHDLNLVGLIENILRENGPMHFIDISNLFESLQNNQYASTSVAPILLTREEFTRLAPGVYGLASELEKIDPLYGKSKLLLKELDCRMYVLARRAGEAVNSFPYWTPNMEYEWCKWAFNSSSNVEKELFASLLAVAQPHAWPIATSNIDYWLHIKQKKSNYCLYETPKRNFCEFIPSLRDLCAVLFELESTSSMNWIRINRVLGRRLNDHHSVTVMAIMVALGLLEPNKHWQLPHQRGIESLSFLPELLNLLHETGEISWASEFGCACVETIKMRIHDGRLGWINGAELLQLVEFMEGHEMSVSEADEMFDCPPETELSPLDALLKERAQRQQSEKFSAVLSSLVEL